ncbi:MAG: DUF5679 domain-containing protein [Nitrososphaerota archaeon]|nr:DUF5679 domain-containing protein [Nitrososphaerota archaeon]
MGILTLLRSWFGSTSNVQTSSVQTVVEEKVEKKVEEKVVKQEDASVATVQPNVAVNLPKAYCFKCKSKVEIKNPTDKVMKNGRVGIEGTCSNCGAKVFRVGKS